MRKTRPSDIRGRWRRAAAKVPQEQRQRVLDRLREGLSVGEVAEAESLELMTVSEIIVQNIETVGFLRVEAK